MRGNFLDKQCQILTLYYRIWIFKSKSESFQVGITNTPVRRGVVVAGQGRGPGVGVKSAGPTLPSWMQSQTLGSPSGPAGLSRCTVVGAGNTCSTGCLSQQQAQWLIRLLLFPFLILYTAKNQTPSLPERSRNNLE